MGLEEVRLRKGDVDTFPIGMRVLAVDDDPICLKLLDGLLRKCQYHVTTTNQAIVALNMLRENRDRFDLVISDVHMPDMDGFKLLEQVGLELDLPVIMLSANSDPRLVLQGVTHGACDYPVKPVRLEELRNIWQHVIRRKKRSPDQQKKTFDEDKFHQRHAEGDLDPSLTCNSDHNGKLNKKRKDDEAGGDENELDNEDPASQKKPRVVWSIDLHRKFVTAVNHLGIEKAVPKRILDMMNVEGLTRENVASHLQKYRLYLRRISSNATHQANLVAALGSKDAYMQMGSLDGFGTYHTLARSCRLANTVLSPYTSSGMLGRLNSPIQNFTSSGIIQPSHAPNFNGSMNNIRQFPSVNSPGNHNGNLIQGTPSCLSLDQLNFANSFPNFDQLHGQRWGERNHNHSQNSGNILTTLNSQLPTSHGDQSLDHINFNRQIGMPSISQSNGGVSTLLQQSETGRLSTDPRTRSNSDYFLGQTMQHGAFTSHDYDSFDDLMTVMVKPEHNTTEIGGGFVLDAHSF